MTSDLKTGEEVAEGRFKKSGVVFAVTHNTNRLSALGFAPWARGDCA